MLDNRDVPTYSDWRKDSVKHLLKGSTGLIIVLGAVGAIVGWILGYTLIGFLGGVAISLLLGAFNAWMIWVGVVYPDKACPDHSSPREGRRNHIICIDGTWNAPDVPTNVDRIRKLLPPDNDTTNLRGTTPGLDREKTSAWDWTFSRSRIAER